MYTLALVIPPFYHKINILIRWSYMHLFIHEYSLLLSRYSDLRAVFADLKDFLAQTETYVEA